MAEPLPKLVEVAIGALIRPRADGWELLISRRPESSVYAGYWEMPGGKVDPGETPTQCLVREFAEELGVQVRVGDALPTVEHHYPHAHVRLHAFYCQHVSGTFANLQVAEHRWIDPAQLPDFKMPEANAAISQRIVQDLA